MVKRGCDPLWGEEQVADQQDGHRPIPWLIIDLSLLVPSEIFKRRDRRPRRRAELPGAVLRPVRAHRNDIVDGSANVFRRSAEPPAQSSQSPVLVVP